MICLIAGLVACSAPEGQEGAKSGAGGVETPPGQLSELKNGLAGVREKATDLENRLANIQTRHQADIDKAIDAGRELSEQVTHLQRQANVMAGDETPLPMVKALDDETTPVELANGGTGDGLGPGSPPGHWLLQVLALIVVVIAILVIIKIFLGRWGVEDEEDYETEEAVLETEEGTIRLSPNVRAMAGEPVHETDAEVDDLAPDDYGETEEETSKDPGRDEGPDEGDEKT